MTDPTYADVGEKMLLVAALGEKMLLAAALGEKMLLVAFSTRSDTSGR